MYIRTCAPSEASDQTAHSRSLIRIFTGGNLNSKVCKVSSCGQRRFWIDCADAQDDLSLRWAHMSEKGFYAISRSACASVQYNLSILLSSTYTTISIDSVSGQRSPDQPARIRRLIIASVVHKWHKDPFHALCRNHNTTHYLFAWKGQPKGHRVLQFWDDGTRGTPFSQIYHAGGWLYIKRRSISIGSKESL